MKKIILVLVMCFGLVACQQIQKKITASNSFLWKDIVVEEGQGSVKPIQAVVLLPLSGKASKIGESLQKSSMMALQDRPESPVRLTFFDTKGTEEGLKEAWEEVQLWDADIVIGPVFANEVATLKSESPSVPVLSFTSDSSIMDSGIYTLGILIPNQVERLTEYVCKVGHRKLAVIAPENKTGELVMNSLMEQIERCPNMTVDKIALYPENTTNFNEAILKIVPEPINPKKKDLTDEEKILLETPIEERIDFDALFIFEDGVKLQQITSLLAYYDVTPKVVPFFGLANWRQTKDKSLAEAYFVSTPVKRLATFDNRYRKLFGEAPTQLSSLAYDAVSLIAALASENALTQENLNSIEGFNGVNGRFRFNADGTNDRLFDIFQMNTRLRPQLIETAPNDFSEQPYMFVEEVTEETNTENVSDVEDSSDTIEKVDITKERPSSELKASSVEDING